MHKRACNMQIAVGEPHIALPTFWPGSTTRNLGQPQRTWVDTIWPHPLTNATMMEISFGPTKTMTRSTCRGQSNTTMDSFVFVSQNKEAVHLWFGPLQHDNSLVKIQRTNFSRRHLRKDGMYLCREPTTRNLTTWQFFYYAWWLTKWSAMFQTQKMLNS